MNRQELLTGFSVIAQFMEHYAYYREVGWSRKKAWRLASQSIAP